MKSCLPFFKLMLLLSLTFFLYKPCYGQTVYANSQTNAITGVCLLCSINNPDYAVDSNFTNYSEFIVPVQLLGTQLSQTLIFPASNAAGCDSLIIKVGSSYTLNAASFANITVRTYNGNIANSDSLSPTAAQIRFSQNNTQAELLLRPNQTFDRVKITYSLGLAGLLGNFRIYYALRKQGLPAPQTIPAKDTTICQGSTVTLSPLQQPNTIYRWYNAAVGGSLLPANANAITVNPAVTTTYYVEAVKGGCTSQRVPVTVIVNPKPADPVYTLPSGNVCGNIVIPVFNYLPGIDYNVRVQYTVLGSLVFDTAYAVKGDNNVLIKDYNYNFSKQADIYIQAVDSLTGCVSDTVHDTFVFGGTGFYPSVDADSVTICKYDSVTLHAFVPNSTIPPILWYSAPTGGTLLFTGPYYKVSPAVTTTYYVTSKTLCDFPVRRPVKVTVKKLPDPVYNVPRGIVCGPQRIPVLNHQSGFNYNVRLIYVQLIPVGPVFDTSFTVLNNATITTPLYLSYPPSTVDVYIQAADPVSGCKSDTVHKLFNAGGYAKLPNTDADSVRICRGDSATLYAYIPGTSLPPIRWYNAPTGGSLLYTGNYFKVRPAVTTTYYVTSGYECEYPLRKPVKVIVNNCRPPLTAATNHPVDITVKRLNCFPNPTTGEVMFNGNVDFTGSRVAVKDINGHILQEEVLTRNGLNLKQKQGGVYILQIITGKKEMYTGKIVLQR
ncbi:Ig-like domain-containing protein [Chitinophaga nivalis]|uniref:T9SS type A sorting domain-containing protein n=1 Tax=Chitinophaga nivalis TaxID=2991709 RepID=A0ABT3IE78_9BACT|nr:T9SS type A sorting domain-containing protein [Chitinophaga nivalis]MCW3468036.1 T9SS type A sorting domain-containing protein [Chitinophaga nivalis]MCW3482273.1 T9SS type A sorting domain-containing protein [Chitinophaga nivalis]